MITIVIPFQNTNACRYRNINFVISHYRKYIPNCEIIVCEQDSDSTINNIDTHLKFKLNDFFKKGFLFNQGYNSSNNQYLFFADADCIVDPIILESIQTYYELLNTHLVLPYNGHVYYLNEQETNSFIENNVVIYNQPRWASGGVVIINSDNFYNVGGFDERFKGWGAEDDAFFNKCISLGIPNIRLDYKMLHLNHPPVSSDSSNYKNNIDLYNEIFSEKAINRIKFDHLVKKETI